ncbi:MAG: hypothetical protein ACF8GE_11900 [Phycisphaerales bacterium JB043]
MCVGEAGIRCGLIWRGVRTLVLMLCVTLGARGDSLVALSPDGTRVAWTTSDNDATVVWEGSWRSTIGARRIISFDEPIERLEFAGASSHLLVQASGFVFGVDVASGARRRLGPERADTRILASQGHTPGVVMLGINARDQRYFDLWRGDVRTGGVQPVQEQPGVSDGWFIDGVAFDSSLVARLLIGRDSDGHRVLLHASFDGATGSTTRPIGSQARGSMRWHAFRDDTSLVYLVERVSSRDVLRVVDLRDDSETTLFEVDGATIDDVLMRPGNAGVQAIRVVRSDGSVVWSVRDVSIEQDLTSIRRTIIVPFEVVARSSDQQAWLVRWEVDGTSRFGVYDSSTRLVQELTLGAARADGTGTPEVPATGDR